jgi:hypothetical protein
LRKLAIDKKRRLTGRRRLEKPPIGLLFHRQSGSRLTCRLRK